MKHFSAFEKRVFLAFFFLTFLLVLLLIVIEWQMVKYSIKLNENSSVKKVFSQIELQKSEYTSNYLSNLVDKTSDPLVKKSILNHNIRQLKRVIKANNIFIFDKNNNLILGEKIKLLNLYFETITKSKKRGYFIATFGNIPFYVIYTPIFNNDDFIGYIFAIEKFEINLVTQDNSVSISYLSYPIDMQFFPYGLKNYKNVLKNQIENMIKHGERMDLIRISSGTIVGIKFDKDPINKASLIYLVNYRRTINMFAQKSTLMFILILLAITLFMITLLGNWFTRTILQPVKNISNKMSEITSNPSVLEPIETAYKGVLGDLVQTFNSMNFALNKYGNSLQEYKIISENLDSGIFWLDQSFHIVLCNKALSKIFDVENSSDIIGENINDFLKLVPKVLNRARNNGLLLSNYQIEHNGRPKNLIINMRRIVDSETMRIVGSITDITSEIIEKKAREALELELIKSNKLAEIGRKVEGIIHNMNSPLNSVLGYAQLLKKEIPKNEDIEKIIASGKILAHYIKSLQEKMKEDSFSTLKPVSINELIEKEVELLTHNLFFKHYVKLELNLAKELPPIFVVYGDLSLCLANIINNAIESLKEAREKVIKISTFKNDNQIGISIEDSGYGISQKDVPNIFEPYFSTKKNRDGGYGLGLAISKHVVDKYMGEIFVESKVGKGSKFTVILPYKIEEV